MKHILFLCTGNSARSLIAEGILRHFGADEYIASSAGSQPTGTPNPGAIAVLKANGIDTAFARSKAGMNLPTRIIRHQITRHQISS